MDTSGATGSKKHFTPKTLERLTKIFGDLAFLENKKVFHTALVTSEGIADLSKLYLINKNGEFPKVSEDWWMYMFLRAYCHAHLTSGPILREERDRLFFAYSAPDYGTDRDIENFYYYGGENVTELPRPKKPIFVMSKSFSKEDITTMRPFTESYAATMVNSNKFLETELNDQNSDFAAFARENDIAIVSDPLEKTEDVINYLLEKKKCRSILIEAGTGLTNPLYEKAETNPIDFLILSVYNEKVHPSCLGKEFTPFSTILEQFDLVYQTSVPSEDKGSLTFYILVKKSVYKGM